MDAYSHRCARVASYLVFGARMYLVDPDSADKALLGHRLIDT